MGLRKRRVKRLYAEGGHVLREAIGTHERKGAEAADVAIMQVAPVVEAKAQRGVRGFRLRERSSAEQQGAGESRLDDDAVAGVEVEHDELGAAPAAADRGTYQTTAERARI